MKYTFCPRCGTEKPYRPTLAGRSFKCACGTKVAVPRFFKQEQVAPSRNSAAKPEALKSEVQTLDSVLRYEAIADDCSRQLRLAEADLTRSRQEVSEKAVAKNELRLVKDQSYSPMVIGMFRGFLAIVGLAPGWIVADATTGTWGCIFFCPLSVKAFLKLADWVGLQKFRSNDRLLHSINVGTHAESRLEAEKEQVRELASKHNEAATQATTARNAYEAKRRRLNEIAAQKRQREERLAKTPRPIELPSTSKINTSTVRSLGVGDEWVYAYSFPSQMNGDRFPIKVGMTSRSDVLKRLDEQMTGTSMPEPASLLLLFKVENGMRAEKALHKSLKIRDRHMDTAVGSEWFQTSPAELVELFLSLGLDSAK